LSRKDIFKLSCGDRVLLSGYIYTARDTAHCRLYEGLQKKKKLPVALKGEVIYYVGPTPAPKGRVIGACGPTTSSRMDKFTPLLLKYGLKGMIGKGERSKEVVEAIKNCLSGARPGSYFSLENQGPSGYSSYRFMRQRYI
jgi:fumarate hydratase subunit beta